MSSVSSVLEHTTDGTTPARMRAVFDRQAATALRLRSSTAEERVAKIKRLKQAVLDYKEKWHRAGQADYRKPQAEVDLTEILPVVSEANDAIRHLKHWMRPKHVHASRALLGTRSRIEYQPRGCCLIISPWNYPVNLTFGPLISALAAGNTAILKPSEMTPQLSATMAKLIAEVFPEDEVALFEGGAEVASALLDLPFDHMFFTGAPAIGKIVMAAAARHLSSVTLELGGRSPTIIEPDAKLRDAARNLMWSKFTNCGQTCIAPDHIYVHASVQQAFLSECRAALAQSYGRDAAGTHASPDYARIVNARHLTRVKTLLDDARARGAQVLAGGAVDEHENYIAPTLLGEVPDDARILDTEIFGPLLPIIPYHELDDVIGKINSGPKPLALYIWGRNRAHIDKLLRATSSGGACINHSVVQFLHPGLPFGGVNNSGLGSSHGYYGFKTFSHERAVLRNVWAPTALFAPPYSPRLRRLVRWLLKIV
ncbi:MAG: aldehyde dehydrogenase family protein [Gammaproteobacteria bacterium]